MTSRLLTLLLVRLDTDRPRRPQRLSLDSCGCGRYFCGRRRTRTPKYPRPHISEWSLNMEMKWH